MFSYIHWSFGFLCIKVQDKKKKKKVSSTEPQIRNWKQKREREEISPGSDPQDEAFLTPAVSSLPGKPPNELQQYKEKAEMLERLRMEKLYIQVEVLMAVSGRIKNLSSFARFKFDPT